MYFVHPETGATWQDTVWWRGVPSRGLQRYQEAKSDKYKHRMERLMHKTVCPSCHGARIRPYPAATLFAEKRIHDITAYADSGGTQVF